MTNTNEMELVVLRVDNTPAEDEAYTVGAFYIDPAHVELFREHAQELRSRLIEAGDDYQEEYLLEALKAEGYVEASPPIEVYL